MTGSPAAADPTRRVLADFEGSDPALRFYVVNDNVMGGRSRGGFRLEPGKLVFSGSTNTNGGGFSSIRSRPASLGLDEAKAFRIRVKGDGRTYRFTLRTDRTGRRGVNYHAEFPTNKGDAWEEIRIPMSAFEPTWRGRRLRGYALRPSQINSVGLMIYDKRDGPFRLEVDWIKAETQPVWSMARYQWKQRPLLLFAPSSSHAALWVQLEAIEQDSSAFRERDMLLIVVLEKGRSRAGNQMLADADAAALRKDYDVKAGDFALRLVGKDGTVKRATSDPVPVATLYEQIDGMPMRQREMREKR